MSYTSLRVDLILSGTLTNLHIKNNIVKVNFDDYALVMENDDKDRKLSEAERGVVKKRIEKTSLEVVARELEVAPNTLARIALAGMRGHRRTLAFIRMRLQDLAVAESHKCRFCDEVVCEDPFCEADAHSCEECVEIERTRIGLAERSGQDPS